MSDRYFFPLEELATRYPSEALIGSEGDGSPDRLNKLLSKVVYPTRIGRPVTTRLRTTWMKRMLSVPISLKEFTAMAGISTIKSLADLIPYIPDRAPELWFPSVARYEE